MRKKKQQNPKPLNKITANLTTNFNPILYPGQNRHPNIPHRIVVSV